MHFLCVSVHMSWRLEVGVRPLGTGITGIWELPDGVLDPTPCLPALTIELSALSTAEPSLQSWKTFFNYRDRRNSSRNLKFPFIFCIGFLNNKFEEGDSSGFWKGKFCLCGNFKSYNVGNKLERFRLIILLRYNAKLYYAQFHEAAIGTFDKDVDKEFGHL